MYVSKAVHTMSDLLKLAFKNSADKRYLRAELILEEAAEIIHALAVKNEVLLFDGLVDLLYVTLGTCVVYDLPAEEGFAEVHRSNMTKGAQAAAHSGDRGKGAGFVPADVGRVLFDHRFHQ